MLRPRLDFLSMTKFYILRKLRKGSKDDFKVEINYEITHHIEIEKSYRAVSGMWRQNRHGWQQNCIARTFVSLIKSRHNWVKPFLKPHLKFLFPFYLCDHLDVFVSRVGWVLGLPQFPPLPDGGVYNLQRSPKS